jgi:hypothetical protein
VPVENDALPGLFIRDYELDSPASVQSNNSGLGFFNHYPSPPSIADRFPPLGIFEIEKV